VTDTETLLRQAPKTVYEYMRHAVADANELFGEAYVAEHPELICAYMQAAALDYGLSLIASRLERLAYILDRET
jgi:hypothetical protein